MRHGVWLAAGVLLQLVGLAYSREARAQVVINEILASPSRDWNGDGVVSSRDDEWVELYNPGDSPVALDGYRIADADTTWRMELSGTLEPHSFRLVYGLESYNWEKATHHSAYGLSLNNTGDTVRLWKFTGPDSAQVDVYTYGTVEGGSDRSVGRFPDGGPAWRIFDSLDPAPAGTPSATGCPPSPGSANSCPSIAKPASWGSLHRLYGTGGSASGAPAGRSGRTSPR